MAIRFCGQCGAELVGAAKFCTRCGAAVPEPVVSEPVVPEPVVSVPVVTVAGERPPQYDDPEFLAVAAPPRVAYTEE